MSADLHIARLDARYRLPAARAGCRRELDAALHVALDEVLPSALQRAGVDPAEEICIRRVEVPVRLRLSNSRMALALAWSEAIARSVRQALDAGDTGEVVRYRSPVEALHDFAVSALRGDLRRAWAWRQLGLTDSPDRLLAGDAPALLVEALLAEPSRIVAVLARVAERGALPGMLRGLDAARWRRLAQAALHSAGVADDWVAGPVAILAAPVSGNLRRRARHTVAHSRILGAARPVAAGRAFAALAVLETDPAALAAGAFDAQTLLDAVLEEILAPAGSRSARPARGTESAPGERPAVRPASGAVAKRRAAPPGARHATQAARRVTGTDPTPGQARRGTGDDPSPAEPAACARRPASDPGTRVAPSPRQDPDRPAAARPAVASTTAPHHPAGGADAGSEDAAAVVAEPGSDVGETHPAAATRFGGLPMLLHLVGQLGLPARIAAAGALRARPARWALHRLALALVPNAGDDDPAALAFAGLAPHDGAALAGQPPARAAEQQHLDEWAEEIAGALLERLPGETRHGALLLDRVCRRAARVEAERGWIEIVLALDDVWVALRRAGLDLDPGWLPWLGCVMRFRYAP